MRRLPTVNKRLNRRDGENERAHRGFLLWAMQAPDARNMRAVARATKTSDNSVRKWRKGWMWDYRTEDPTSDVQAATMYAALYHRATGGAEVTLVAEWMGFEYVPPGTEGSEVEDVKPSPLAQAVDAHLENDQRIAKTADQRRRERLEAVLDLSETAILNDLLNDQKASVAGVGGRPAGFTDEEWLALPAKARTLLAAPAERKVKLKVADVQHIVRARAYLNATKAPVGDSKASQGQNVARSRLVERMIEQGADPAVALQAEYVELGLILDTLRDHASSSNVVRFPGRAEPEGATGG